MDRYSDKPPEAPNPSPYPDLARKPPSIPSIHSLVQAAESGSASRNIASSQASTCQPRKLQINTPLYVEGLPLKTYILDKMPYTMQAPENEDVNIATRKTIDGRTLTYKLTVLQQPERARACGAGARSAADRRPVDPPPVIELRVFEGESKDLNELTDITLKHNATFILCASLEFARPIAHGRMHTPQTIASLQGVNFAGTNYLDRPSPAGYFIFPDLSVRNEGWYRLNFSLLEGTKEPQDSDPDRPFPPASETQHDTKPRKPFPHEDMATRLDVRSKPFQVFSAKKFPGLTESTDLSRLVADQGCRVRIRRDVRMRKHGERRKDELEPYDDSRRSEGRMATPDNPYQPQTPIDRARSASRASMDGSQSGVDHYRRISADTVYSHNYQPGPPSLASGLPSPSTAYPGPVGTMVLPPAPVPYPSYSQPAPFTHPTSSNSFAVPQPRLSVDNSTHHSSGESRPPYPVLPQLRSITPDLPKQLIIEPSAPAVSSIHSLTNGPPREKATFDATRNRWNYPETTSATKRSHSPKLSYTQSQPLKGGMRPDAIQDINSWSAGSMEPDPRPYSSDSDENDYDTTKIMMMKYRRANGSMGRKPVPNHDFLGH